MCRKVKKLFLVTSFVLLHLVSSGQLPVNKSPETDSSSPFRFTPLHSEDLHHPDKKRVWIIGGANAGLWTASFIALNKAWYADYPRSSFHLFNDNAEWNQMDKAGHLWTNYLVSRLSADMWEWTGLPHTNSVILGGLSGVAFQSIIEIQDGFSSEWGFSLGDMGANIAGAAMFVWQDIAWKEQRIQVKLGYWPYKYPENLVSRRNQLFGEPTHERILKDYNSQTYWISANIKSFLKTTTLPGWLNIATGYGSDGMLGGTQNTWTDKSGVVFNRSDIPRTRHFYLSPDIDLSKIKTNSKLLKTVFYVANMVKIPAPAVGVNSRGRLRLYGLKF